MLNRGWGIAALPLDSFMTVESMEELLGIDSMQDLEAISPPSKGSHPILGTGKTVYYVPDNPGRPGDADPEPFDVAALAEIPHVVAGGIDFPDEWGTSDEQDDDDDDDDEDDDEDEDETGEGDELDENFTQAAMMELGSDDADDEDIEEELDDIFDNEIINQGNLIQPLLSSNTPGWDSLNIWSLGGSYLEDFDYVADFVHHSGSLFMGQDGSTNMPATPENIGIQRMARILRSSHAAKVKGHSPKSSQDPPEPLRSHKTRGWGSRDKPRAYFPHIDSVVDMPDDHKAWLRFLEQHRAPNFNDTVDEEAFKQLGKRYRLLRCYEKDMELRSLTTKLTRSANFGILCTAVTNMKRLKSPQLFSHFRATSRLSMVFHVPELRLVVVGSPTGHVVLVTLTKLARAQSYDEGLWSHGFRVEWVLPRRSDEDLHRKHLRPLHGIAVGPVNDERFRTRDESVRRAMPVRCRLMLHYRNHDILTYEITREEETEKLSVW
jgi:hypothetical protein